MVYFERVEFWHRTGYSRRQETSRTMWDGFLLGKRYLIHDRDPLFTEAVRGLLRDSGVKPLRLPANSPNLNAYAERFVLSIRRECLDRFVPLSERHLRTAVTEYVVHYHKRKESRWTGRPC